MVHLISFKLTSVCFVLGTLMCCSELMGQRDRRDLPNEPEMRRIQQIGGLANAQPLNQAAGVTLMNGISALGAIHELYNDLDVRLRDELVECRGKCPKLILEYGDLQIAGEANGQTLGSPDPGGNWVYPRIEAGNLMTDYCYMVSGMPPRNSRASEEMRNNHTQPLEQVAKYNGCLQQIGSVDEILAAHKAAIVACSSKYKPDASDFVQQPYDDCVNAKDPESQMCSKIRKAKGKTAVCMAMPPNYVGYIEEAVRPR